MNGKYMILIGGHTVCYVNGSDKAGSIYVGMLELLKDVKTGSIVLVDAETGEVLAKNCWKWGED